jgi:acetylornithine deacetylase/succinyl-diaminopimelate desuccinylase-like protein
MTPSSLRCVISTRLLALALAFSTLAPAAAAQEPPPGLEIARRYREAHGPRIVRELASLLALPNVAADTAGIERNAEELVARLAAAGVRAELLRLPGVNPAVWGELDVPGATRTLGIYVHYDGQPVEGMRWTFGPWTPTLTTAALEAGGTARPLPADGEPPSPEWRLYARSASDDKAPIAALLAALHALREAGLAPTSNLRLFLEGEEEVGSPNLGRLIAAHRERFAAPDGWLFLDGPSHASGRPQLTFGVRGVCGLDLTVYGANRSLHSGHYGNWAPVPGQLLADLLASMKDARSGRVLVRGFYDSTLPLGEEERVALAALPSYDAELMKSLGLAAVEGEGASLAERLLLPGLVVHGLASGNVGREARNAIPPTAEAALGLRLVAGNDPGAMLDLVEAHIREQGFHVVREEPDLATRLAHPRLVKVERRDGYPAARTAMSDPWVQGVIAAARTAAASATGNELVLVPALGGSLPLFHFTEGLGKPVVIAPVANHDNNQHAADENLRLGNLWYAVDLYGALLTMR